MHPHLFTVLVAGFLLCVALQGVVHHARANGFVDMIHVICIPEAGLFEFSGVRIEGQQSIRAVEENPEEMSSKYGLYDPNNYIDFESVPTRSAYNVGNIFEFGQGIPPQHDYKIVFERLVDGLEPPKSRRLPRSGR